MEQIKSGNALDSLISHEEGIPAATNIMIIGDPGVGKTTVLLDLLAAAQHKNPDKKCVRCVELEKDKLIDAIENDDYCGKHQSYKKWKELTNQGHQVCVHWIRGCFEIIKDNYKACINCRTKNQTNENANNLVKKYYYILLKIYKW